MRTSSLGRATLSIYLLVLISGSASAKTLKIISNPPGATVQFNGQNVGITPYERDFPKGYFDRQPLSFQKRLDHSITLRLTLEGYVTYEESVTVGPKNWTDLHRTSHGEYWVFKADEIVVDLSPVPPTSPISDNAVESHSRRHGPGPSPVPDVIARVKPAVVSIRGPQVSGSGFFVNDSGLIATNAHVAGAHAKLAVTLASGQQLTARLVFQDPDTDIALITVELPANGLSFPYLLLADPESVLQGEAVIAIGYPAAGIDFTVTQGLVSSVGKLPSIAKITWVQTDAALNPGSSGGPLLDLRGQVVGIVTEKPSATSVTGIGFALSSVHLSAALKEYHPLQPAPLEKLAAPSPPEFGQIEFTEPEHAVVSSNAISLGQIPMQLSLPPGSYTFFIKPSGQAGGCIRHVQLLAGAHVTVRGDCFSN